MRRARYLAAVVAALALSLGSAAPASANTVFSDGYASCQPHDIWAWSNTYSGPNYTSNMRVYPYPGSSFNALYKFDTPEPMYVEWDSNYGTKYRISAYGYISATNVGGFCST